MERDESIYMIILPDVIEIKQLFNLYDKVSLLVYSLIKNCTYIVYKCLCGFLCVDLFNYVSSSWLAG